MKTLAEKLAIALEAIEDAVLAASEASKPFTTNFVVNIDGEAMNAEIQKALRECIISAREGVCDDVSGDDGAPGSLTPGDVVRLKSGGPSMTIAEVDEDRVFVEWFRTDCDEPSYGDFGIDSLERVH